MERPGQKEERVGNLWHMSIPQLKDIMECKRIPLPTRGTGRGVKSQQPVKRDYIDAINRSLGITTGAELTTKKRGMARNGGLLSSAPVVVRNPEATKSGGYAGVEACIGTGLPGKCLLDHGFVEKKPVAIPDVERLWSTIVGYTHSYAACSLSVWNGANDTLIVQNLGTDPTVVEMWTVAMNRRPNPPRWADAKAMILFEPMVVKDRWICKGENGSNYAFCLVEGLWAASLELLFKSIPQDQRHAYPLISVLDSVVQNVVDFTSPTSTAGRDTQHYAWRFEKDPYGKLWLVVGLLPLPYFYSTESFEDSSATTKKVPVDKLVRSAASGNGGLYLTSMLYGEK